MKERDRNVPPEGGQKPQRGGVPPQTLAHLESEGARVAPVPPKLRRPARKPLSNEATSAELDSAVILETVLPPEIRKPPAKPATTPPTAAKPKPRTARATKAPADDIADRDADVLIKTMVEALVTGIRAEYSAEHRVYSDRKMLEDALANGRRVLRERRTVLTERLRLFAGANVERVRQAWDAAVMSLGDIELQEEHWSAQPENLIGAWSRQVRITEEGDVVQISFIRLTGAALFPTPAAQELEEQALPAAIAAALQLVDWEKKSCLSGDLTASQAEQLGRHRDRVARLLEQVEEPHRSHYRNAFNASVAALAIGDTKLLDPQHAPGLRLRAIYLTT